MRSVNTYVKKNFKFPDPLEQAQRMFIYTPEDLNYAAIAERKFLQSLCDTENANRGIYATNQRFFEPVTNVLKENTLLELYRKNKDEAKQALKVLVEMSRVTDLKHLLENLKPSLLELKKAITDDEELVQMLNGLTKYVNLDVSSLLPNLRPGLRYDLKVKLGPDVAMQYTEMIKANEDPLFGFDLCGYDKDDVNLKGKIAAGELPTFRIGLPIYLKMKPSHIIGLKVEGDKELLLFTSGRETLKYDFEPGFFEMCTTNTVDNQYKEKYMTMIDLCIKNELREVKERSEKDPEFLKSPQINNSKKFTDWIYPALFQQETPSTSYESREAVFDTPAANTRGAARKREEAESSFKTPTKAKIVKPKIKLSPEGKKLLQEQIKQHPEQDIKYIKQELKNLAEEDPNQYGFLVQSKDGSGLSKIIIVPPNVNKRIERIKVILASHEAGVNADDFEEYSALVDSLVDENYINNENRVKLINAYTSLA